jgi:hypothetical protein
MGFHLKSSVRTRSWQVFANSATLLKACRSYLEAAAEQKWLNEAACVSEGATSKVIKLQNLSEWPWMLPSFMHNCPLKQAGPRLIVEPSQHPPQKTPNAPKNIKKQKIAKVQLSEESLTNPPEMIFKRGILKYSIFQVGEDTESLVLRVTRILTTAL